MTQTKTTQPIRTCIVCRGRFVKELLVRYVWERESGSAVLDTLYRMPGRGVYCCRDQKCRKLFVNRKQGWKRAFRLN